MANVSVSSSAWTELSITSGTVQNVSATADIELSAEQVNNSGVVLKPSEIYQWDNETIYARAVTEESGALRVVNFKKAAGGGGGSYTLPAATVSKLGGVKIGSNVTVAEDGTISVAAPYSLPIAAANTLGGVKIGSNVSVDANGTISVAAPYSLPTAATDTLGGVKVGSGLSITNGVLSATGGGGSSGDPVGRVVFDVILRDGYIKANGATVSDASTSVPNLLTFVQANPSLLANNQAAYDANHGLYLYDSGTDTFTLPNFIGKFVEGGNSVEEKEAGLPNITSPQTRGYKDVGLPVVNTAWGNWAQYGNYIYSNTPSNIMDYGIYSFDASQANSIYGNSITVQPPAITLIPQIKY